MLIARLLTALRAHFGHLTGPAALHPWWPIFGDDPPFEILVGAVLVQQTRWEAVEATLLRLIEAQQLSPAAIAASDPTTLALMLRPVAFYTQKTTGLMLIARHLLTSYAGSTALMLARPTADLREELLGLPRIGRETCDVVLLYGGGHPIFVVDEYTRRLFERVFAQIAADGAPQARPIWRQPYEAVRRHIEAELTATSEATLSPVSLYAELHAQINEVCVRYCLSRPRCDGPPARRVYSRQAGRESYHGQHAGCPLRPFCGYYQPQEARKTPRVV